MGRGKRKENLEGNKKKRKRRLEKGRKACREMSRDELHNIDADADAGAAVYVYAATA